MKLSVLIMVLATMNAWGRQSRRHYDDDQHGDHHGHHHGHHRAARVTKGDDWVKKGRQRGRSSGYSKGKGSSSTYAGPKTSNASAHGTHGSGSRTGFQNNEKSARNNWHNYVDSEGRKKQVSNSWRSREANDNNAVGRSRGWGKSAAVTNNKKSGSSAWGKHGADAQSEFNNDYDDAQDNWSRVKIGNNWKNTRDNQVNQGRTSTRSKAQGLEDADAATESDFNGSKNEAVGRKGSRAASKHKSQRKRNRNQRKWGKVGKNRFNQGKDQADFDNTMGGTDSQAWGKGGVNSYTDRKKGSASHGKGTQGTKNDAVWAGNDWSGSNAWDDSTWKSPNHDHHGHGHDHGYDDEYVGSERE